VYDYLHIGIGGLVIDGFDQVWQSSFYLDYSLRSS
jgi:hypothetical protein